MRSRDSRRRGRVDPIWWTPVLFGAIASIVVVTALLFNGTLRKVVPITLVSDRAGLVMEPGAKVKLRGVEIGYVGSIGPGTNNGSALKLKIDQGPFGYLPSNVEAEIKSSTAFGAKYVNLVVPTPDASPAQLKPGAVLKARNVTVEVNTVFENLQSVVTAIDPAKLNAVLSALAEALRGKGQLIGEAITASNDVLLAVNPRMETVKRNWQLFDQTLDAYSVATQDILTVLDSFTTTSSTITSQAQALDDVLLSAIGFGRAGVNALDPNQDGIVGSLRLFEPTTALLAAYSPTYTCLFQGAQWFLENGGRDAMGGNGKSVIMDSALLFGDDPYRFPDNLPKVNARGGPGGRPSCGSLPDPLKNFPVKYLVTDTGFGTGLDVRPNPGIGFPGWADYFPVTRAVPEPPSIRYPGGPAPGPLPGPAPATSPDPAPESALIAPQPPPAKGDQP
jgi:phospholipid/cholesterol/gamma-HCH transport system substrate-binding protein